MLIQRRTTMTSFKSRLLVLTFAAAALLALGQNLFAECSDEMLRGSYAFTITGQILAPAAVAGPVSGVAVAEFFGDGTFTQVDHVLHNGQPPQEEWRPGSGTYHLNSDCTGYMILTANPTVPADASPELRLEIVVGDNGNEIRTAVSGSPKAPAFTSTITSIATRVHERTHEHQW
jgi:hypothetical protein